MKVTECWTIGSDYPDKDHTTNEPDDYHRPAVLMWKEDYDELLKEAQEGRALKERTKIAWTEAIWKIREGVKK